MLFKILEVYARPDFPEKLRQHIVLSLAALLVAIAIALPIALMVRNTRLGALIAINIGNIGRAVPSLAILALIQLPIAAPVIFAGIKTSAVQTVASATLATFIGGGGLGDLIVEGYSRKGPEILLAGALAVAILALITEIGFGVLERAVTPKGLKIAQKRGK